MTEERWKSPCSELCGENRKDLVNNIREPQQHCYGVIDWPRIGSPLYSRLAHLPAHPRTLALWFYAGRWTLKQNHLYIEGHLRGHPGDNPWNEIRKNMASIESRLSAPSSVKMWDRQLEKRKIKLNSNQTCLQKINEWRFLGFFTLCNGKKKNKCVYSWLFSWFRFWSNPCLSQPPH